MKTNRLHVSMPIRRKLLSGSAAYIAGIYLAQAICFPETAAYFCCALLLCVGVYHLRHRRSALLFVMAALFILGNCRAGRELRICDESTAPGTTIEGTVSRIESDTRVYLKGVVVDGEHMLNRPVAVTLMQEKDKEGNPIGELSSVSVGQIVYGTGRLFEQEGKRNPGGVDWRIYSLCKGYDLSGYILPGWQVKGEASFSLTELFRQARLKISDRIDTLFGERAPLIRAVIIGDRSDMDDEVVEAMRLTGIVHILTVSGMHMSLMALVLHVLLSKIRMWRCLRFALEALFLGCFACLTGCAIGTIRAYIMALIRSFASLCGRRYDPLTALGAAALMMALICPIWALGTSFQFSFIVVLGILLLSSQLTKVPDRFRCCPDILRRILRAVAISFSAQCAAVPMQLMYYGYIPMLSLPMNLICGLCMPALMLGGWGAIGISVLFPRLAYAIAKILGRFAGLLEEVSLAAASNPWGIVRLPAPDGFTLFLMLLLLAAMSEQLYMSKHRKTCCMALMTLIVILYMQRFNTGFQYVQLDVGQGDGAVLRKGRGAVLIDVGPADDQAALRYLRHEGLTVDLVILSHPDEDHAGAMDTLLDSEVKIERIAMPTDTMNEIGSQAVLEALSKAGEMGVKIEGYEKGDVISSRNFEFTVLSPEPSIRGMNERSLVLYSEIDGIRLLTLGDLPSKYEMDSIPRCDVLKVAHHGSRYATSRKLLDQAMPEVALISVGRNSYGHPTDRVLEDLWDIGADVFRTDVSGCITVKKKDDEFKVVPYIQ